MAPLLEYPASGSWSGRHRFGRQSRALVLIHRPCFSAASENSPGSGGSGPARIGERCAMPQEASRVIDCMIRFLRFDIKTTLSVPLGTHRGIAE